MYPRYHCLPTSSEQIPRYDDGLEQLIAVYRSHSSSYYRTVANLQRQRRFTNSNLEACLLRTQGLQHTDNGKDTRGALVTGLEVLCTGAEKQGAEEGDDGLVEYVKETSL